MSNHTPQPGRWMGHDWFFCPVCPFDRDNESEVAAHIAATHQDTGPTELQQMTAAARAATEEATDGASDGDGAEPGNQTDDNDDRSHVHRVRRRKL